MVSLTKMRRFRAYGVMRSRVNVIPPEKRVGSGKYKMRKSALILYWKGGPTFSDRLPQWDKIASVGRKCREEIKGIKDWKQRKEKLRECVLREFGKI